MEKSEKEEFEKLKNEIIKSLNKDLESDVPNIEKFESKTKLLNVILCAGEFMYSLKSENIDFSDLDEKLN